jgi:hypothetical protein
MWFLVLGVLVVFITYMLPVILALAVVQSFVDLFHLGALTSFVVSFFGGIGSSLRRVSALQSALRRK